MFRSYLTIAWRNLVKNKAYSVINIGGLAIGMAVAMVIGLWIYDELSFDKNNKNYDRVAQVLQHQHISNGLATYNALPLPLAEELRSKYGSNFDYLAASLTLDQFIGHEEKVFTRLGSFAEPSFPNILSLEIVSGARNSIDDPTSVLISESLANTLFGSKNALYKQVKINNQFTQQVTGIYKDFPKNSRFNGIQFIAPLSLLTKDNSAGFNWQSSSFEIYTLLDKQNDAKTISAKIKNVLYENSKDASQPILFLHPMSKWHLYEFKNGNLVPGRAQFVWLFGIIGLFVLILACINFMNLNTARSGKRAKEVSIRKTLGSVRRQLIYQFFCESLLIVLFASVLAVLLVTFTLPWFNQLADKNLTFPFYSINLWLTGIAFILVTVLLAGSYPALYLSSFNPVKVLKGTFRAGKLAAIPRKLLVVVQFTVSVTLIIGTILVFRQVQFARNRPIGYTRDRLFTIALNNAEIANHYEQFKNDLLSANLVEKVAISSSNMTNISSGANNLEWKGKDPNTQAAFGTILIDPDYAGVVKWKLSAGRDFSPKLASDSFAFIFNEAAIQLMGLKKPVGENVRWHGKSWHIIGIAKDMVMTSPFEKSVPTVFLMNDHERSFNVITVKLKASSTASTSVSDIEKVFKKYSPSAPFDYKFTDEAYAAKFNGEERIGKLAALFASLAIFISCLGLFGLASYIAEQRTKEIGVRKVLGASVYVLWKMLSKDFVNLVLIGCLIAVPISYYFMNQWLQQYEYHTTMDWWVFGMAMGMALLITVLTVSFQSVKAALANPVKSLRSE
jgi:putative ABC transport system permease protein